MHRIAQGIREGQQEFDMAELIHTLGEISGAQRRAILRLAEEIDRLRAEE